MRRAIICSAVATTAAIVQLGCRDVPTPLNAPLASASSRPRVGSSANTNQVGGIAITDLGFGVGNAINDAGAIVGYTGAYPNATVAQIWYSDGSSHGFLVDCPPACGTIPFPGCDPLGDPSCQPGPGAPSAAFALNNTGKVVGYYTYLERPAYYTYDDAFIWTEGAQYVASPFRHHHGTRLYAINDAGQSAGSYRFDGPGQGQTHAITFDANGTLHDLGAPVGTKSVAYDLNASGDAVGQSPGPDDYGGEAILWPHGGSAVRLGFIGGNTMSAARAINDAGTVVGWMRGSVFNKLPFRWSADHGLELLPTTGNGGTANAINNDGYIVGTIYSQPNSSAGHAALWTPDGQVIDLGTLSGGRSEATGINSHLQVSGDATDANGQSHVVRWDVAITTNHPPVADAQGPYTGAEGSPVAFNGSVSDPDGDISSVVWQFGDGESGSGPVTTHTYLDNGTYTATLTVTDSHGLTASSSATITISNVSPVVQLSSAGPLLSGQSFQLTTTFTDPGIRDMPWQFQVDWGLGSPSTGSTSSQNPIVTTSPRYCAAGNYTVRAAVTDKDGGIGSGTTSLEVDRITVPVEVMTKTVNLRARGELPVAVFSTSTFDAREIDVASVVLSDGVGFTARVARQPKGRLSYKIEDVNRDGRPDLLLHFERPDAVHVRHPDHAREASLSLRAQL